MYVEAGERREGHDTGGQWARWKVGKSRNVSKVGAGKESGVHACQSW